MFTGDDVIDFVPKPDIVFVDETILATIFRAAGNLGAPLIADFTAHTRGSGELLLLPLSGCVRAP